MTGDVRTKEDAPGTLLARRSEPVAEFSQSFAPMEHDSENPPRGLFAAIRTAGLWQQIGAFADRVRALLRREAQVADRERVVAVRERELDAAIAAIEVDRRAAREDRTVAAGTQRTRSQ